MAEFAGVSVLAADGVVATGILAAAGPCGGAGVQAARDAARSSAVPMAARFRDPGARTIRSNMLRA
ncbi:hypothetical protein GCM10009715_07840 [Paeniglutamicibacter psychrophenolicus]